jgi:aspartate/methionine/tyrosine aminotransferase
MVRPIEKLSQNLFICASSIAQHAGLACFTPEAIAIFEARKEEFRRRRDYIVPALRELGFKVPVTPDGAFYVYADCSALSDDADALTIRMLNEAGVVLVPGLDFGPSTARQYIRVSYATSMENLQEAVSRLRRFFAKA